MELSPTGHRNLSLLAQQWVGNVLLLGAFLFLFIGLLDYVISPENFKTFMTVRIIMSCVLLFLCVLNKLKTEIWYQYAIMLVTAVLCAIAIEFMVLRLGGPRSTYYAGFIIIITCCLGFVPLSLGQSTILAGVVYAIYLIPITSLPALRDPIFINNNVFLFSICIIVLAWRWQSQKRIVNELVLQEELERKGQQLQQELSERMSAEHALQESEKRYRMLFESAGEAIYILDVEGEKAGNIVALNKSMAEMHGYAIDELVDKNIRVMDTPEAARKAPGLTRRILDGEWITGEEMTHRRKNGTIFSVEMSAGLLEFGNHKYILVFERDITYRKNAELKLRQYATELKQSNEDVLSFAYIVSHDLRAPLASIKGFAGELQHALQDIESILDQCVPHLSEKERTQLATTYRKDVPVAMDFIRSSVGRMDGLINAILALSRLGHRELKPEPVDMKEVVKPILNSLAHQIEQRKTVVNIGELPTITADKLSMEQIMGNLLDNALKYLDPGREGTIAISAEHNGGEIVFHVSDNGRGIAQEDMHKVFEIFRRAGKQDVPGEGMGLAYVKTLVRKQGGRIWCDSELGKGTTFRFTIPSNGSTTE